jgi:hypothetical protein
MVVKSATKKKLMDLGIEEEHAHKLAENRKWAKLPSAIESLHPQLTEGLGNPVSDLSQEDILHIIYGRTEAHVDEWWTINDIYARIQGLKEIEVPIDLGIVNHGRIMTLTQKIEKKPKKLTPYQKKRYRIQFPEEVE